MQASNARRASIILGIFMAVVLIGGTILQLFAPNIPITQETIPPTDAPIPTFPPPVTNLQSLSFDKVYLHPSGMYAIAQPDGWTADQPNTARALAQVNMVNNSTLSVIDAYVEDAGGPVTVEDLSPRFTQQVLAQSWSRFSRWTETNRRLEGETLLIDFQVTLQRQTYIARQKVWTDGEWIYVVRVLTPENARDYLLYILDNVSSRITPFKEFAGTPFEWLAYYDVPTRHIIRYPAAWTVTDSAPGRTASIAGANGEALRVEARPGVNIADEGAARAWLENERPGATILSVRPVTRGELSGFSVAYSFVTPDGDPQSGLALLLNGDDRLHIANLRFPAENVDLNAVTPAAAPETAGAETTPEAEAQNAYYGELALVMSTFRLMPALDLSEDSLPPATPVPTPLPPTTEATEEATAEAEPEATAEAAAEAATEAAQSNLEIFAQTATALAESVSTPEAGS